MARGQLPVELEASAVHQGCTRVAGECERDEGDGLEGRPNEAEIQQRVRLE